VIKFDVFIKILTEGDVETVVQIELTAIVLGLLVQVLIVIISDREWAVGHLWAYIFREYVAMFSVYGPLYSCWNMNKINIWEGSRKD